MNSTKQFSLDASEAHYKEHGKSLFSSHMIDLSEEPLEENIEMSMFGADFIRRAKRTLHVHDMDMPDINFQPHGFLFLATEKGAEVLERKHAIQR